MARRRVFDLLQSHAFWLLDVDPSARPPFFVLGSPLLGFSKATHPEITLEHETIPQMNDMFPEHALSGASVGPITLSRGSRLYDSTFFTWVQRYIDGEDVSVRNLLLIQNTGMTLEGSVLPFGSAPPLPVGGVEILRIPGKAWMLWDARPTRYSAGGGLDATSSDVTEVEIEIQPHSIDEFSIDPVRIADSLS